MMPRKEGHKTIIFNEFPENGTGAVFGKPRRSDVEMDGIVAESWDSFDARLKSAGLPEGAGSMKGFIATSTPKEGLMLVKVQFYRVGARENAEMKKLDIDSKTYLQGVKQVGLRKVFSQKLHPKQGMWYYEGKTRTQRNKLVSYTIPYGDLGTSLGVYEDPARAIKGTNYVRQYFTNLFPEQSSGKSREAIKEEVIRNSILGDEKTNERVARYRKTGEKELVDKIDVDEMDIYDVVKIIAGDEVADSPLYTKVVNKILNKRDPLKDVSVDDMDSVEKARLERDLSNANSAVDVILETAELTPGVVNSKLMRPYAYTALRNYIINRALKPKAKWSGKAIGKPYDAYLEQKFPNFPKQGYFMLDEAWKNWKIFYNGQDGVRLEDAFKHYKAETNKIKKAELYKDLNVAIIRVPSDSISGTRAMRFYGFTGRRGAGIVLRQEDMSAMGGMDLDIDSVFMYQNVGTDIMADLHAARNEWKGVPSKTTENLFVRDYQDLQRQKKLSKKMQAASDVIAMSSPLARWEVAHNARTGNKLLGTVANARRQIHSLMSLVNQRGGNMEWFIIGDNALNRLKAIPKFAKEVADVTGLKVRFTAAKDKGRHFRMLARDAMNFAADAADYTGLVRHDVAKRILFDAAFPKVEVFSSDGKKLNLRLDVENVLYQTSKPKVESKGLTLNDTLYGNISQIDKYLNGKDYNNDRAYTLHEVFDGIKKHTKILKDRGVRVPGMFNFVADALSDVNISGNPRNYLDIDKAMDLAKQFNKVFTAKSKEGARLRELVGRRSIKTFQFAKKKPTREERIDYDTNDFYDMASVMPLYEAGERAVKAGTTSKRLGGIADLAEVIDGVYLRLMEGVKTARKKKIDTKNINISKDVKGALGKVRNLTELENATAKIKRQLKNQGEKDYFDLYLLGSLHRQGTSLADYKKSTGAVDAEGKAVSKEAVKDAERAWSRTDIHRLGYVLKTTSRHNQERLWASYNRIYRAARKEVSKDEVKQLAGITDVKVEPSPSESKVTAQQELSKHWVQIKDAVAEGTTVFEFDAEHVKLMDRLNKVLVERPDIAKDFESFFEGTMTGLNEFFGIHPTGATKRDLKLFVNELERMHNKGELDRFLTKDGRIKKMMHYIAPQTVANITTMHDMLTVKKEGVPVKGFSKQFTKDVQIPLSSMGALHEFASQTNFQKEGALEVLSKRLSENVFSEVKSTGADAVKLLEIAVARIEGPLRNEARKGKEGFRVYGDHLRKAQEDLLSLSDKVYNIPGIRGGSSAEEVVARLEKGIKKELRSFYNEHIKNVKAEKKFFRAKDGKEFIFGESELDHARVLEIMEKSFFQRSEVPNIGLRGAYIMDYEYGLDNTKFAPGVIRERKFVDLVLPSDARRDEYAPFMNTLVKDLDVDAIPERYKPTVEAYQRVVEIVENTNYKGITRVEELPEELRLAYKSFYRINPMTTFSDIGDLGGAFWPHSGWSPQDIRRQKAKEIERLAKAGVAEDVIQRKMVDLIVLQGKSGIPDGGFSEGMEKYLATPRLTEKTLQEAGMHYRAGHVLSRNTSDGPIPGWARTADALENYENQIVTARYNITNALLSHKVIRDFEARSPFGEEGTKNFANFMRLYVRDNLGYPSTFPSAWRDGLNVKGTLYNALSDERMEKVARKIGKKWFNGAELGEIGKIDNFRKLAHLSNLEAKWEMMTLLASTKTMVNNLFGGSLHTQGRTGYQTFRNAMSLNYLKSNVDRNFKSWADVEKWVSEHGSIESWVKSETGILSAQPGFRDTKFKLIWEKSLEAIKKNKEIGDRELISTVVHQLKEQGVTRDIFDKAAWFMRKSERKLRMHSFVAHYLQAREVLEANGTVLEKDHPWLIKLAQDGVAATQFIYNNASRPAFSRTAMGKVFTRFKLFAFNSLKLRKDVLKDARALGFANTAIENERVGRFLLADLFLFSLAQLLPASMFESALPQPWSALQDFGDFFFGDEKEKERAFFGTAPYPANIFNPLQPPIARLLMAPIGSLLSNDWGRFASYHVWTWFPFGRLAHSAVGAAQNPAMTIEKFTGFPAARIKPALFPEED